MDRHELLKREGYKMFSLVFSLLQQDSPPSHTTSVHCGQKGLRKSAVMDDRAIIQQRLDSVERRFTEGGPLLHFRNTSVNLPTSSV